MHTLTEKERKECGSSNAPEHLTLEEAHHEVIDFVGKCLHSDLRGYLADRRKELDQTSAARLQASLNNFLDHLGFLRVNGYPTNRAQRRAKWVRAKGKGKAK